MVVGRKPGTENVCTVFFYFFFQLPRQLTEADQYRKVDKKTVNSILYYSVFMCFFYLLTRSSFITRLYYHLLLLITY